MVQFEDRCQSEFSSALIEIASLSIDIGSFDLHPRNCVLCLKNKEGENQLLFPIGG